MNVTLVTREDLERLREKLTLEKFRLQDQRKSTDIDIQDVHRRFNHEVCVWLDEIGRRPRI